VVVDRAYDEFEMLHLWRRRGVFFVCRVKEGMAYTIVEDLPVPDRVGRPPTADGGIDSSAEMSEPHVVGDQIVELARKDATGKYPEKMRVVTFRVHEEDKKGETRQSRMMKFFTDDFKLSASTIAEIH
jgi:hypothetical protein